MIRKLPFVIFQHPFGYGIYRGRDKKSARLGNRFAQEFNQRVMDAYVADACGCEKKFHNFFLWPYRYPA
jgi:hypothetical protein